VLRAAVMASVGSVGALLGRWDRLEHPLILSAGILLLWNPESLFQAGFQMSYAATLAIAVVWGLERDRPGDVAPPSSTGSRFFRRAISWARELLVTSVSAQVALAPLLLYYFGRLSWVGIVANMVAVPLSGLCLTLGAGLVFLDGIWPAAASVWAVPTRWSAEGLAGWAHLCAKTPGAEWHHAINGPQAIALAIGVALGFTVLHLNKKRGVILMALTAATLVVVWGLSSPKPFFSLKLSWGGGRSPSVRVQTEQNLTVFEKGEPSPLPSLLVDGGQWVDGRTRWEVIRPEGGDGFAIRIHSGQTQTLLNFGLTAAQQAEWLRRGPIPVDLLSWASGKGGPPKEELLRVLSPRWIVYQGTRIPLSVRQFGSAVYRPGRSGLSWRTDETISGFDRGFPGN
jgi:ComEC/Rec2-related protein